MREQQVTPVAFFRLSGSERGAHRLPKGRIIRRKGDFQRVYHSGRSYANRYLVLYVYRDSGAGGKVGFAAGKKLGCAAVRNRIKRILRESYRLHQGSLDAGCSILLVGRKALAGARRQVSEEAFLQLCRRAGILAEEPG